MDKKITSRDFETSLFETVPFANDDKGRNPKSKVAIPSEMSIESAKNWVDNGSKL